MTEQESKVKALELAVELCRYNTLQIAGYADSEETTKFVELIENTVLRYAEKFEDYLSS